MSDMTGNLTITSGDIALSINGDPSRVIRFNPTDVLFVERYYSLMGEFEKKMLDYQLRGKELGMDSSESASEEVITARLKLMRETCEYVRTKVDELFGQGTSQVVFGDAMNLGMFEQFFDGLLAYVKTNRIQVVSKYTRPTAAAVRGKKTKKTKK